MRDTYVEVNLNNIRKNVESLIKKYNNYKYYFGVVKADCYGHGIKSIKSIIEGGCNYLAVATIEEALEIRNEIKDVPILCFGIINPCDINICIENNITITINSLDYLKKIITKKLINLKIHIKLNTGMNRLGIDKRDEFNLAHKIIKESALILEGIYTHIHSPLNEEATLKQFKKFEEITSDIDLASIPIVHVCASDAMISYQKKPYVNGCRLGIGMYGLMDSKLNMLPTFSLYSRVIQINEVENETVGYNGAYKTDGKERIAIVPIGYADGIIRKNTGRYVYINNKSYKIVGNICMDMLFVKIDDIVKVGDKVVIIKDIKHIKEIANYLDTITYEVICSIGKRVPRLYI